MMQLRTLDVDTGEVKAGGNDVILRSNAIGSCIVVACYDPRSKTGGLAHILVPGTATKSEKTKPTKYAKNAVEELINKMISLGARKERIEASLIGGGNVLRREGNNISQQNLSSIVRILIKENIKLRKTAVGGTDRRSVILKKDLFITEKVLRESERKHKSLYTSIRDV